jgi:vacuolar-type H+-ATPase subunit E/Vma4
MKISRELINQNQENSEELCVKIRQEAEYQCNIVLGMARKEAEKILSGARKDSETQKAEMLKDSERELEKIKERIFSTLNLEKRRVLLGERSNFAACVLEGVKKEAERFRSSPNYPGFLKKAILEGAGVIDQEQIEIIYSALDDRVINGDFVEEIQDLCRAKLNKNFSFNFQKSEFKDIGVLVQSQDGHLIYDNRFAARLQRSYDDIYMSLLKESF